MAIFIPYLEVVAQGLQLKRTISTLSVLSVGIKFAMLLSFDEADINTSQYRPYGGFWQRLDLQPIGVGKCRVSQDYRNAFDRLGQRH